MPQDLDALYQMCLAGLQQIGHDAGVCPDEDNEQWASEALAELLDAVADMGSRCREWRYAMGPERIAITPP